MPGPDRARRHRHARPGARSLRPRRAMRPRPVASDHPIERSRVSAFIITRIQVGDYAAWRPMFDQDRPRASENAKSQRIFRSTDDPTRSPSCWSSSSTEDRGKPSGDFRIGRARPVRGQARADGGRRAGGRSCRWLVSERAPMTPARLSMMLRCGRGKGAAHRDHWESGSGDVGVSRCGDHRGARHGLYRDQCLDVIEGSRAWTRLIFVERH